MDLEEVWRIREEDIYPNLFGQEHRGIFPLDITLFTNQFQQTKVDPRWLNYGVIEFSPTPKRASWLYVTSGHSNPWEEEPADYDEAKQSGGGVEFTLETAEKGDWAIRVLQSMLAFDVLLSVGRYPGKDVLGLNDRIPMRAPLNGDPDCLLRSLVVAKSGHFKDEFVLPSGVVQLLSFTAISDRELAYAKENGSENIISRLGELGFHPVNDPFRRSII